jgi:hypothetical protein
LPPERLRKRGILSTTGLATRFNGQIRRVFEALLGTYVEESTTGGSLLA